MCNQHSPVKSVDSEVAFTGAESSTLPFRADIEGLRALAVLAVMGFHYGVPILRGGFVGVDVFFVISGYLITGLLIKEISHTDTIDLARFYARRARRLLPAALLVSIASLICTAIVLSPLEQIATAKAAIASSMYVSNLWFAYQRFDYFSTDSAPNPFVHTWSLSIEEQFYLLWPAALLVTHRSRAAWRKLPGIVGIMTVLSLLSCIGLNYLRQPFAFFTLPARAWEFGVGGLLCLAPFTRWIRHAGTAPVMGWIGLAALSVSCCLSYSAAHFPGPDALLAAGATGFILLSGASGSRLGPMMLLRARPFQVIGKLSYSIYLWHWPILVYGLAMYPSLTVVGRLACGLLTVVCASLSYIILEKPIRKNRWLAVKEVRSLALAVTATVLGALIGVIAAKNGERYAAYPLQKQINDQTTVASTVDQHGQECLIGFNKTRPLACTFGPPSPVQTLVIFGDSHADQWSTPIIALALQQHWQVVTYLKSACAIADIQVFNQILERDFPECTKWRALAIAEILRLHPAIVVVGEFSNSYIQGLGHGPQKYGVDLPTWAGGLYRTLRAFDDAGIQVALLRDSPMPSRNIRNCLATADWRGLPLTSCDTQRSTALNGSVAIAEKNVAAALRNVHFIDFSSAICDETVCPAMRQGVVVYRDASHLTGSYAWRLFGLLKSALLPLVQPQHGATDPSI